MAFGGLGKKRKIGAMIYFGLDFFTLARNIFGSRWYMVHKQWGAYQYVLSKHFRGIDDKGEKFVYCPVSLLVSWHSGDYNNEWCHFCGEYYRKP